MGGIGHNCEVVFRCDEDRLYFLDLECYRQRFPWRVYHGCLMTHPFYLVLRPEPWQSVSRIMQSLTLAPTWHHHRAQATVGHVWQGRFRSPVIEEDDHSLVVLRYIERNPLRAAMVSNLAIYPWSSYRLPGMGRAEPLLTPLPAWERLGKDEASRQADWRTWVQTPCTAAELAGVRRSRTSGRPFGSLAWTETMARSLGISLDERKRDRPKKEPAKKHGHQFLAGVRRAQLRCAHGMSALHPFLVPSAWPVWL